MRKTLVLAFVAAGSIWLVRTPVVLAQTNTAALGPAGLTTRLAAQKFLGTQSVLTLSGDYVNSPKEDFETTGLWTLPLSLEDMPGVIGEIGFGEATKQGEWQLRLKTRLLTTDPAGAASSEAAHTLTLADRRSQMLKASYNVKDWWQVGAAAFVADRFGSASSFDPRPLGLRNGESVGFQFDTKFKF